jgi:hypothetical protein
LREELRLRVVVVMMMIMMIFGPEGRLEIMA